MVVGEDRLGVACLRPARALATQMPVAQQRGTASAPWGEARRGPCAGRVPWVLAPQPPAPHRRPPSPLPFSRLPRPSGAIPTGLLGKCFL